jgi:hypothetical protein
MEEDIILIVDKDDLCFKEEDFLMAELDKLSINNSTEYEYKIIFKFVENEELFVIIQNNIGMNLMAKIDTETNIFYKQIWENIIPYNSYYIPEFNEDYDDYSITMGKIIVKN